MSSRAEDRCSSSAQLKRGQYLAVVGDCMSCHIREGGQPFAGGLGLKTPFGLIYSANITSDKKNGLGSWTWDQFHRAMREGKGKDGELLYPVFPVYSSRPFAG